MAKQSSIQKNMFRQKLIKKYKSKRDILKSKIKNIDKVFYTHHHADQTHGINELRFFYLKNRKKIDIYTNNLTKKYLLNSFGYCFKKNREYPPILQNNSLKKKHSYKDNGKIISLKSIKVEHGNIDSICYVINNKLAYASDVSKIHRKDLKYLNNLKYLVISKKSGLFSKFDVLTKKNALILKSSKTFKAKTS